MIKLWQKTKTKMAKNLFKYLVIISGVLGIIMCLINAQFDGYAHWTKRLLYFTTQSNLWIIAIKTLLLFGGKKQNRTLFIADFIFTVNIALTGIIFCTILGPFADESYHAWSISGHLTHVFVPLFAILDFLLNKKKHLLKAREIFLVIVPALIYFFITTILVLGRLDFGRGDTFPYFFFSYNSPAGIFGFSKVFPFVIGSFYWMAFIIILLLLLAFLLGKLNNGILLTKGKLLDTKNSALYNKKHKEKGRTL